jgi:hypothetical protein
MDVDKLSTGEKVSAVSAILLFVFMFFDWFGIKGSGGGSIPGSGGNAWDALDFIPVILLITIAAALGVALIRLIEADFEPAISLNAVVAALGILSVLLIFFRVLDPPSFGVPGVSLDATRKFGLYLGLFAAAGIAYGGYRAMQEEGTSFADAANRLSSGGRGDGPSGGPTPPPPPPPSTTPPPPPPPSSGD